MLSKEYYCSVVNDGVAVCVCKYRPCEKLKHKEQECEKLKNTIQLQNQMQMEVVEEKNQEIEKLKRKEHECEELKETIRAYQEDRFCQGGCAIYQFDKIQRYKQVIDKIEKLCIDHPFCDCSCGQDILDIIDEAKEQEK